jgi:signal peptidase I
VVIVVIRPESAGIDEMNKTDGFVEGCFEWTEALISALIAVMVLFVFLFRVNVVVDGPSMQPNFFDGYRVFVNCADRSFSRGDVIVIDAEGTNLNPKARIIKRVIATAGDRVDVDSDSGYVLINGKPLDESGYIQNGITQKDGTTDFPTTVPSGCVFVLGDNRTVSEDSRFREVGMVNEKYIIGKVGFLLSPFKGFQLK